MGETRANPHLFLHRDPKLLPLFENLKDNGKKIFLITNSPFETVDVGMSYMMGHSWRDFFDVIIVQECFSMESSGQFGQGKNLCWRNHKSLPETDRVGGRT